MPLKMPLKGRPAPQNWDFTAKKQYGSVEKFFFSVWLRGFTRTVPRKGPFVTPPSSHWGVRARCLFPIATPVCRDCVCVCVCVCACQVPKFYLIVFAVVVARSAHQGDAF